MSQEQLQLSTWGHRGAVAAVIWEGVWQRRAYSWVLKAHRYEIWTLEHRFALQGDRESPLKTEELSCLALNPLDGSLFFFNWLKRGS